MFKQLPFTLLLALAVNTAIAQDFTLSGEIRPRTEFRHGFKTVPATDADYALFTNQRSRLNFDYKSDLVKVFISLQDIRTWGNTKQLVNNAGEYTAIHQAWAEFKLFGNVSAKLGRQEIILDNHRILGNVGWAQQARSHDAAMFNYGSDNFTVKTALAFNQEGEPNFGTDYSLAGSYKAMQLIWMNYKAESFNISGLFLNNGQQNPQIAGDKRTIYSQISGLRAEFSKEKLSANANVYLQSGKLPTANTLYDFINVSGSLLGGELGYKVSPKFSILAGYEQMSGNDELNLDPENYKSFTPYYGTNHKFNGLMDYFYVGNHINSVGLKDVYFTASGNFSEKFKASATFHVFDSHADIEDPNSPGNAYDGNIGSELDLVFNYKLNDMVGVAGGYSQYFTNEGTVALKGGDADETSNWAWIMITIKPKFFTITSEKND